MEHQRENSVEREKKEIHTHTHTQRGDNGEATKKKRKKLKEASEKMRIEVNCMARACQTSFHFQRGESRRSSPVPHIGPTPFLSITSGLT